jgi:polyisoprenoid-binding protein YceI
MTSEIYRIDSTHSAVRLGYDDRGWTYQQHGFDRMIGKIVLDRVNRTVSVSVTIDIKSVNTGQARPNNGMQGPAFFDMERFPTIAYESTNVQFENDKPIRMEGALTIKGITRPVSLDIVSFVNGVHPVRGKRGVDANAFAKVKRSDFGIARQTPRVADEVSLSFALQAFKD